MQLIGFEPVSRNSCIRLDIRHFCSASSVIVSICSDFSYFEKISNQCTSFRANYYQTTTAIRTISIQLILSKFSKKIRSFLIKLQRKMFSTAVGCKKRLIGFLFNANFSAFQSNKLTSCSIFEKFPFLNKVNRTFSPFL